MVSVCLPSDSLLQHLPSYLGFSSPERGASLHGCSSKAHLLLLTLDEVTSPDLEHGVSLHDCFSKVQSLLLTLGEGYLLTDASPDLEHVGYKEHSVGG